MSAITSGAGDRAGTPVIPEGARNVRAKLRAFQLLLFSALAISAGMLGVLLWTVASDGVGNLSWDFLNNPASFNPAKAGIFPAIMGTLWLMGLTALFIVPVGVAAAIYLEEYADRSKWWNRVIEVNIQNLAAVPSIVYGILGLAYIVRGPLGLGRAVLAGSLTLGLLVLPVVIISSREALRAVPPSIREGALALGATQWQAIWRQVLPSSIPGIATGVILALSRAIGETAPLIVVGAATYVAFAPAGPMDSFTALPIQIFNWISQPQPEFKALAAAAIIVLMGMLLLMNSLAIYLRNRYENKW
jgi:phosphate transport system permease protein